MNTDQFKELVERYISGALNAEERAALQRLLDDPRYEQELANLMDSQFAAREPGEFHFPDAVNRIKAAVAAQLPPVKRRPLVPVWLRVAAAAAVITLVAVLTVKKTPPPSVAHAEKALVLPGNNKAVLMLADGSAVTLDSGGNRVIQQGGATIHQQGGQLQYAAQAGEQSAGFNTLATPKGGQYQVTLPDGTRVWLNASSSLRFPVDFSHGDRTVALSGEAYFEVAPHAGRPFRVQVNDMTVEVLGTHFNVTAYAEDGRTTTTLLQGAVRVSRGAAGVLLKPGQQALLQGNAPAPVAGPGDTEGAVAWKNGYFKFANENIQLVMRKIARWYNVEVEYEGDVTHKVLWGTVSRTESIEEVMKMLELTGSLHLRMEGRKIIVTP